MPDRPERFADALRTAMDARGLGLDRITEHLAQRGVSVSAATLSYWRSGRSEPGRRSSLAALPHLEDVLGLPSGSLTATLPSTRERTPRRAVRGLDALWPEEAHSAVLGRLDTSWDTELARVSVHDILHLGPDRRQVRLTVRQAMRARADGPDRRVVMHSQDDLGAGLPEIRPLRRGETVIVKYDVVSPAPGPCEREYTRRLRLPMREYLLEVAFDARALPESVAAFAEGREQPIVLDEDRRAHLVHTDTAPGTTGIRWSWPGD